MLKEFFLNPVFISVTILMILSICRMNVVFALIIAAVAGGFCSGMNSDLLLDAFSKGLGNGAGIAFNYAILGAFSIAISRSGITELLASVLFKKVNGEVSIKQINGFKYMLIFILTLVALSSQNLIPVHIAFIPILIPPLLSVFQKIKLDRRMVACILTFGLITPYMFLPFGFGRMYLNEILIKNICNNNLKVTASMAPKAMFIPALGMVIGLLIAIFISYRKPREYDAEVIKKFENNTGYEITPWKVIVGVISIGIALAGQIIFQSLFISALSGIIVFIISRVISFRDTQDIFTKGIYMMGGIGIVMITASGFASVMKATGGVDSMVEMISNSALGANRSLAVFVMLLIGLLITLGIGSSFSTVPLIAAIYVPLCMKIGISPLATVAIIGVAGALGDAGSPVSESVLGPTAGLNADGQHDHIFDSTIPTFIHFNLPLLAAGWIAGMIL